MIIVQTAQDHLLLISKIYMTQSYNYSAFFLVENVLKIILEQ